uniref:uncharacterized protein LOC131127533 n=1 Tax=Doryrhamphus excisus TaxID=161450 RepID=UPI0025AE2A34|nr:uncharacterized protein LOC131127533 [Doryrhamphus excisus]
MAIVESLDKEKLITIKQRRVMVRILVSHLMEKCGQTPSAVIKIALASAMINTFPCLKDGSGSGFDTWYTQGRYHHPATGFLEERLRNIRKRLRSSGGPRQQQERVTVPSRTVIPAATISDERALQCSEWLKNNSQPLSQVEAYMRDTCQYRAGWIRADHSKSIPEILGEFPRLTTPGMIAQDFSILYGEAAPKLFETWVALYSDKIIRLAKCERKLSVPEEQLTHDSRGEVALMLLPILLPPPVYKKGRKLVRASIQESKRAFIDVKPVGTNMVEYLEQAESLRAYPYVLLLSDGILCSQAFAIISGKAIPSDTALAAVDTCFKSFYILDCNYPNECAPTWQFLQSTVFELEGTVSPSVTFLKTQLLSCH